MERSEEGGKGEAAMTSRRTVAGRWIGPTLATLLIVLSAAPASAEWATREGAGGFEAGTTIEGQMAGLVLRCAEPQGMELALTHNGAVFDRNREHTIVVSVDGTATLLSAHAFPGARAADDDFVHWPARGGLDTLLSALARGRQVEISAPSGRYTLPLSGSSRAIAAFRERCPGA